MKNDVMKAVPVFDGHNDTVMELKPLQEDGRDFFIENTEGDLDLPRARRGGFAGGLFAVFVPAEPGKNRWEPIGYEYARRTGIAAAERLRRLEAESQGALKVVRDTCELGQCFTEGVIAAVLHFEGAAAISPDLAELEEYYGLGLRSLGITWSRPNVFGYGVDSKDYLFPGSPDTGPGLTEAGYELIRACNKMGIIVDLAHLNERGFWDAAKTCIKPLVASHSNAHALCASPRNLTDDQLKAIGDSGGIVGVNFCVSFLRADGANDPNTPLSAITRHIDYIANLIGIDYVGLGSDFDGALIPAEIGDVAGLPRLIAEIRAAGYSENDIEKIAYRNWLRVINETWV